MKACLRQVDESEVDCAYTTYLGVFDWLKAKGIRQWLRPLSPEVFRERAGKGELFALWRDEHIAAVVTLAFESSSYWPEVAAGSQWWIKTLAVARQWRGRGLGGLVMRECEARAWDAAATAVFLDCVDGGYLPNYYTGLGYTMLGRKEIIYPSGNAFPVALMRKYPPDRAVQMPHS